MTACRVDIIISSIFRYSLLFGLTTHVYDSTKHQLVHSPKALYYSASFHIVSVFLLPVFCKYARISGYFTHIEAHFFEQLFKFLLAIQFCAIFLSIVSQWTFRANGPMLFNEIIQMWYRDMAHLQWSPDVNRQAGRIFTFKAMSSILIIVNTFLATFGNVHSALSIFQGIYLVVSSNIIIAVTFQFSSGMIFSDYLFRTLNYNLIRVGKDISGLRHTQGHQVVTRRRRRREVQLCKELTAIGRLYTQLRKWVVRFKDMYQLELLFILTTFFASQILMLFLVCVVFHTGLVSAVLSKFLVASLTATLCAFDLMFNLYICGRLLAASNEAAQIIKDLPTHEVCCTGLERCIEMMCLEMKGEKLRLTICGLFDLHGSTGFTMTEAAMMYIILLIQLDYENL